MQEHKTQFERLEVNARADETDDVLDLCRVRGYVITRLEIKGGAVTAVAERPKATDVGDAVVANQRLVVSAPIGEGVLLLSAEQDDEAILRSVKAALNQGKVFKVVPTPGSHGQYHET